MATGASSGSCSTGSLLPDNPASQAATFGSARDSPQPGAARHLLDERMHLAPVLQHERQLRRIIEVLEEGVGQQLLCQATVREPT